MLHGISQAGCLMVYQESTGKMRGAEGILVTWEKRRIYLILPIVIVSVCPQSRLLYGQNFAFAYANAFYKVVCP
jgi:hypothetical protein